MKNNKKRNLLLSLILAAVCIAFLLYVGYDVISTKEKQAAAKQTYK